MPFWKKTGRNNSEVKEEKPEGFYIQCPFCGQRFLPSEVKFRFEVGEDREIRYFCTDTEKTCGKLLKEYCQEHGYKCKLKMKNGIPMEMVLEGKTEVLRSPFRVCANDNCNQGLSNHAGFYPPGNGIFFLGERSSGKTVMLTTLVKVLQERAVSFLAELVPYNERVKEEYRKNYYDVLYRERMMPKATVAFHSMAFEWIKYGAGENRMTELNFSDIRGEDADNAMRIFNGMSGKNIQNSPGFILTVDL